MRTIYLLRHAKAQSGRGYDSDHARELAPKGHRQAQRLGRFLLAADQLPDRIVTSTAVRAHQTALGLSDDGRWGVDVPVRATQVLYECSVQDVLDEIHTTSPDARSVLLVGHQPTWAAAISELTGGSSIALPTGTCARLDASIAAWGDLDVGDARLAWLLPPSLLQ